MRDTGAELICPVCKKRFRTYIQGSYGKICKECKSDFGVRNGIEADEMLQLLDEVGDNGVKELAKARQVTKPPLRSIPPRMDPAKLLEATKVMTDYGVLAPLPETLTKPTTYALAKNGLFEVRESDVARIVIQPKEIIGLTETLTPGVTLRIPKLPYLFLQQTVAFFREVCVKMNSTSEALVQVWWNRTNKEYLIHVPEQSVSGGGVDHRSEFDKDNERDVAGESIWLHVMDIHSHGSSMSAFWSCTDNSDERKAPEGRMFGVIGRVQAPLPEWKWRMRTREGFIDLNVSDVFQIEVAQNVPFTVSWGTIFDVSAEKDGISQDGRVRLLCPVDPFKDATCPAEWHTKVKGTSWGGHRGGGMGFTMGHYAGHNPIPMYVFVATSDNVLEEFLVDAERKEPPKPTGKKVVWRPKPVNDVH